MVELRLIKRLIDSRLGGARHGQGGQSAALKLLGEAPMNQIGIANANLLVDEVRWRVYCYHDKLRINGS